MSSLHVLLFADNVVVRRATASTLRESGGIRVTEGPIPAPDALPPAPAGPAAVVLHLEGESGSSPLDVLRALRAAYPSLPVVVLAPRTHDGAVLTFRAFDLGAVEVVTTPPGPTHVLLAQRHLAKRLPPAVRAAAFGTAAPSLARNALPSAGRTDSEVEARLVVVGACTGGPRSLVAWLGALQAPLAAPVLVVQHFPVGYTSALARWLSERTGAEFREAPATAPLRPGTVWIAPGGRHLEVRCAGGQCSLVTHRGPRESGCRPSIDVLFRSAAQAYGASALGVVLSGAGRDGISGAKALREAGASVLVQDPASAPAWELPDAALPFADDVLTPEALAESVASRTQPVAKRLWPASGESHRLLTWERSTRPVRPPVPR